MTAKKAAKKATEKETEKETEKAVLEPFEIEKNIPMPQIMRKTHNNSAFDSMDIGDSFHIAKTDENPSPQKRLSSAASNSAKRLTKMFGFKVKFCVRVVDETDPKGIGARVFRVGAEE